MSLVLRKGTELPATVYLQEKLDISSGSAKFPHNAASLYLTPDMQQPS